jgi:hypothetical protein
LFLTTPLPIIATARAGVPVADNPPSIITVGADRYLAPAVSKTIRLTLPLVINALAVVPVPELLINLTVGGVTYPLPPATISKLVTE